MPLVSPLFFLTTGGAGSGDFEARPPNDLDGEAETVLRRRSGAGDIELRVEARLPTLEVEIFLVVFSTL